MSYSSIYDGMFSLNGVFGFGIDGKYDLNGSWSLLVGFEYQYHSGQDYFPFPDPSGNYVEYPLSVFSHHYRLPVMAECHFKWFYVAPGLYYEICKYASWYKGCAGICLDIGGKVELTDNNCLRIGLRPTFGMIYKPDSIDVSINGYSIEWELTGVVSFGFEHRF